MNSDSGRLSSVLSGVPNPSTPQLSSSLTPQEQPDSHNTTSRVSVHSQGHVYSLSGHIESRDSSGQNSHTRHKKISSGHYNPYLSQRPGKLKKLRLLPYQECHRAQFLCLEQDTELLMQRLQARIQQS